MIRINLLNAYRSASGIKSGSGSILASEDDEKKKVITDFIIRAAILLIGPMCFYFYESQTLPVLSTKLTELNQKHEELKNFNDSKQGLAEEIKKFEIEQARYNAQTDFINKIDSNKVNEYKLFQHLKESTPKSVWINKLDLIDNTLVLLVESDNAEELNKFMLHLSNAEFISNLVPTNQTIKKDFAGLGVGTTVFTLKAQLNLEASK